MGRVTYIIGNGLDLSLGLHTSYRDFYEFVQKNKLHSENRIYKAIEESPDTWSDFETALGRYTDYIDEKPSKDKKKESEKFHEELDEVREDLATYIQNEEQSVVDAVAQIRLMADSYRSELPGEQMEWVVNTVGSPVVFDFITLNYTMTLEYILSQSNTYLTNRRISTSRPLHIHGDLQEAMILGVSDESQMSTSMPESERNDLIKPALIESLNDGRINRLNKLIKGSSVIVLYGTSIGETDSYIWRAVTDWLAEAAGRFVVIHAHDDTYTDRTRRSPRVHKQSISRAQEKLLRFSGRDGDERAELKKQILVVLNTRELFRST